MVVSLVKKNLLWTFYYPAFPFSIFNGLHGLYTQTDARLSEALSHPALQSNLCVLVLNRLVPVKAFSGDMHLWSRPSKIPAVESHQKGRSTRTNLSV